MKIMWMTVAMVGVLAVSGSAWAGGSCCPAKGKKAEMSSCTKATMGLDLSDEQKAKISEIEAACKEAGSSEEACAKAMTEIRQVLSDEQRAKYDEACGAKSAKKGGGCG